MAAGIGLLSMTQIHNLSQSSQHQNQPNPNSTTTTTMWNPREQQQQHQQQDDDSWEVRAFAEDTRNIMGSTWPPRSYTCTFCRREFRSAQALGGHMNVHRRDRARLHHHQASHNNNSQDPVASGGVCLLYHFPSPNNNTSAPFSTTSYRTSLLNNGACGESPSTLCSVSSSYPFNNNLIMMPTCSPNSFDFPGINGFSSYSFSSSKVEEEEEPTTSSTHHEELDLELRLGNKSTPT